jgi:hypothetical protein
MRLCLNAQEEIRVLTEDIVKVLTLGSLKYSRDNWMRVPDLENRYFDALMRHLIAYRKGESLDKETNLPHLSHAACCLLFLQWGEKQRKAKENLPPKEEKRDIPKKLFYTITLKGDLWNNNRLDQVFTHMTSDSFKCAMEILGSDPDSSTGVTVIDSDLNEVYSNPYWLQMTYKDNNLRIKLVNYMDTYIFNKDGV